MIKYPTGIVRFHPVLYGFGIGFVQLVMLVPPFWSKQGAASGDWSEKNSASGDWSEKQAAGGDWTRQEEV